MIEFTIDDKRIEAEPGETVLQAALRNGIEIPHFCYHPCLSIAGNCRICMVRVKGRPGFHPSCNMAATAGMEIENDCAEVTAVRKSILQFATLNHPADCPVCDKAGECRLQDYNFKFNGSPSPSVDPKRHQSKFYQINSRIMLDRERCILCSRCVRFTNEISGSGLLGIVERGSHSRIERLEQGGVEDAYADNIVEICPVGALLSRDFLYKSRVWYLEPVASVCPRCSRGCSVNVWRRQKNWQLRALGKEKNLMAYRISARQNPEINGSWLCSKGFDLHNLINDTPRALTPMVEGKPCSLDDAIAAAQRLILDTNKPAAIVSAWASNEELAAFKSALASWLTVYSGADQEPEAGEVIEDQLLIKADKNPNRYSVEALFGKNSFAADAGHDLVLVWGDNIDYADLGSAKVIHLATLEPKAGRAAEVLIPISTMFERTGHYTNFEGKVNRFEQVFEKPESVQHAVDVFGRL